MLTVAERLKEARAFDGSLAVRPDRQWEVLVAIERCGGAPTLSDLGRLLGVSRQAARTFAIAAARVGVVELFPAPDDRRTIQVALTPAGRRALEVDRMPQFGWLFTLLNGLEPEAMHSTHHVLDVIRLRLERYAREMRHAQRGIGSPFKKAMRPRTCR